MTIQGKSVYSGVAIGRLAIYRKSENQVKREKITDTAKQQLAGLYDKALKEVGEVNAAIFEVHQMMLNDLDYIESITNMIEGQQVNAEYAVATTGDTFSEMFAAMDDDYMRERAADVRDVSNRVVSILMALACGLSYMLSGYHSLYSSQGFRTSKLFSEFLQPKEEK